MQQIKIVLAFFLLLLGFYDFALAKSNPNNQSDIQSNVEGQEGLKQIELAIASVNQQLRSVQSDIQLGKKSYENLLVQQNQYQDAIQNQKQNLISMIRLSYALERANPLKLLLNQQNLEQLDRNLSYSSSLNTARIQTITQLQNLIENVKRTQEALTEKIGQLNEQKKVLLLKKKNLQKLLAKRLQIIQQVQKNHENSGLEPEIVSSQNKSHWFFQQRLDNESEPSSSKSFNLLKGKLKWPVQGKFLTSVNAAEILAPAGEPVHAVYAGKIIFANWLKGMGLLIIVDHGQGYISLYGHLQHFAKKLGEHVQLNDVIGYVGDTGGISQAALYFQIREQGKAVNLKEWCTF